jgi:hypothetical protein
MPERYVLTENADDGRGEVEIGRYPSEGAAKGAAEHRANQHHGQVLQWHTYAGGNLIGTGHMKSPVVNFEIKRVD